MIHLEDDLNDDPDDDDDDDEIGDEVFSFFPTHPTSIYFTVGGERLVLCWDDESNSPTVYLVTSRRNHSSCLSLPPSIIVWLKLTRLGQTVKVGVSVYVALVNIVK